MASYRRIATSLGGTCCAARSRHRSALRAQRRKTAASRFPSGLNFGHGGGWPLRHLRPLRGPGAWRR
eukprot:15433330-Alexandrium_andersonii.AAC.1